MKKGTDLQEIIDAVKVKIPSEDLSSRADMIIQLLKGAVSQCSKKTYDKLDFEYCSEIQEGYFINEVSASSIELLSMYIVRDYLSQQFAIVSGRKQYLGTQAFNKLPLNKDRFDFYKEQVKYWTDRIQVFEMEFPDYSVER